MRHLVKPSLIIIVTLLILAGCGGSSDSSDVDESSDNTTGETPSTTSLSINEIVASAEDDGNDWFELYAITDIDDLSNYSVVDDDTEHQAQSLPAISLSAGDFLVIQAIDEADATNGEYYVNFKLGGDDALTLFENAEQIDSVDWEEGDAPQGYSYGRYTDGTGTLQTMLPTPGEANTELTEDIVLIDTIVNNDAPIRINEIVAKDADGGEDWIELYVVGTEAIYLGDYTISDENDERVSLPDITLAPGEFYRIYATTDELESQATVGFKLGSSDQVNLYLEDDLVDRLSWAKRDALIGYSFGRYPDGSDAIATLVPSPESANVNTKHNALVINEVVASHVDDGNDWFELYNNSNAEILLSDYSVIDSSSDIDAVSLPSVYLSAGDYIVIYAVDEYPGSYFVPFKLGKEDELSLILSDETVDYIEWQESDVSAGYSYGLIEDGGWATNTLSPTLGAGNQLPEVYAKASVESIYFEIDDSEWQDLLDNALDEEYHLASLTYKGVTLDEVGIRTKGNSSLQSVYSSGRRTLQL